MKNSIETNVILTALEERYSSLRIIRERIQSVTLWVLGMLLAASGFLFQSDIQLKYEEKLPLLITLLITYFILKTYYFDDLAKGFYSQRKVASNIEGLLGLYDNIPTGNGKKSVYPKEWKNSQSGNFVRNNNILISFGFIILGLSIIFFI
jgi:hypothetical protein